MIHLIHGEDIVTSRKELETLKSKHVDKELVMIEGKSVTLTDLTQALQSTSLFGGERLVVIESYLSRFSRGKDADLEQAVEIMLGSSHEIVLWEGKEIGKLILKKFPETIDRALFNPTQLLFRFLDTISPGKQKILLATFAQVMRQEAAELVLYMLVRQFRFLLLSQSGQGVGSLAPWQQSKLAAQAKLFTDEQLLAAYTGLFDIEYRSKTGQSPFNLTSNLRQFLVEL